MRDARATGISSNERRALLKELRLVSVSISSRAGFAAWSTLSWSASCTGCECATNTRIFSLSLEPANKFLFFLTQQALPEIVLGNEFRVVC